MRSPVCRRKTNLQSPCHTTYTFSADHQPLSAVTSRSYLADSDISRTLWPLSKWIALTRRGGVADDSKTLGRAHVVTAVVYFRRFFFPKLKSPEFCHFAPTSKHISHRT